MNKLHLFFSLFCLLLGGIISTSCDDPMVDTSGYYFKAISGEEDKLSGTLVCTSKGTTFEVAFDTGQDWTITLSDEDASWIHVSATEGGKGVNRVQLTIDPYAGAEDRVGEVLLLAQTMGKKIKVGQSGSKSERARAKRSVLIYAAAENSLGTYINADLSEIIVGASEMPDSTQLLVYVDDNQLPRIYELGMNSHYERDTIRVKTFDTELDSASGETLEMVLNYMKENYTSDEYGLVMWSHGEGWDPGKTTRWVCVDNGQNSYQTNNGTTMDIHAIDDAIAYSVGQVAFLFFDACFMQTVEVAYELKDHVHYMVGFPCEAPGPGAPYNTIVSAMFDKDLSRGRIASEYYSMYQTSYEYSGIREYGVVMSTMDLTQMDNLAEITATYLPQYFQKGTVIDNSNLTIYGFSKVAFQNYSRESIYVDLKQIMQQNLSEQDFARWLEAFNRVVISYSAMSFWYSSNRGICVLDIAKTAGVAASIPNLFTDGSGALDNFKQTSWYSVTWSKAGF